MRKLILIFLSFLSINAAACGIDPGCESGVVDGNRYFVINPDRPGVGRPWVWYAPSLASFPGEDERWMFQALLASGIAIAGVDVGESYGNQKGVRGFSSFYGKMTSGGYSKRPVLLARSRGGLQLISWASKNPDKVGAFAGIYPVFNIASYPGQTAAAQAFGVSEKYLEANMQAMNPIETMGSLESRNVPMMVVHGDSDTVVPASENALLVKRKYPRMNMGILIVANGTHDRSDRFFRDADLVSFIRDKALH